MVQGNQQEIDDVLVLSVFADALSILNFWLNLKQVSSDTLMKELKRQDAEYLDLILQKLDTVAIRLDKIETKLKGNFNEQ